MKYLVLLCLTSFLYNLQAEARDPVRLRYYTKTPNGRAIRVFTPNDIDELKEDLRKPELKGQGQEYNTRAEVKDGKVEAWVRGCNRVLLGDTKDPQTTPNDKARLEKLKTGDMVKVRLSSFGGCEVGGWNRN